MVCMEIEFGKEVLHKSIEVWLLKFRYRPDGNERSLQLFGAFHLERISVLFPLQCWWLDRKETNHVVRNGCWQRCSQSVDVREEGWKLLFGCIKRFRKKYPIVSAASCEHEEIKVEGYSGKSSDGSTRARSKNLHAAKTNEGSVECGSENTLI